MRIVLGGVPGAGERARAHTAGPCVCRIVLGGVPGAGERARGDLPMSIGGDPEVFGHEPELLQPRQLLIHGEAERPEAVWQEVVERDLGSDLGLFTHQEQPLHQQCPRRLAVGPTQQVEDHPLAAEDGSCHAPKLPQSHARRQALWNVRAACLPGRGRRDAHAGAASQLAGTRALQPALHLGFDHVDGFGLEGPQQDWDVHVEHDRVRQQP